jgi:hypothetical protein
VIAFAAISALVPASCGPGGYPAAESLAGEMTPEWEEFAERVDHACASNFNDGQQELAELEERSEEEGWSENRGEAEYRFIQAEHQQATYDEIASLGEPPAHPEIFYPWLANVGHRAELMREAGQGWAEGDRTKSTIASLRITAAKIDADWLGVHFGLRVCASNGPSNNLGDEEGTYLQRINEVCRKRIAQDHALWRRGKFSPNDAAGTAIGETLSMAAEAPPIRQYELRQQILEAKRKIDRFQIRAIKRAARSGDPSAWIKVRDRVGRRILQGRARLAAEFVIPDCAWPNPAKAARIAQEEGGF